MLTVKGLRTAAFQAAVSCLCHRGHERKPGRRSLVEFRAFLGILFVEFKLPSKLPSRML